MYLKLQRYAGEDLSQAGVTVLLTADDTYKIAFGAVGPVPLRARRIEKFLRGKPLTEELIGEAKALVSDSISPITDIRSTKEYRARMCQVMLHRGLRAVAERRRGQGPAYGTRLI